MNYYYGRGQAECNEMTLIFDRATTLMANLHIQCTGTMPKVNKAYFSFGLVLLVAHCSRMQTQIFVGHRVTI